MLGKCILYAISKFVFINLEDVVGVVGEGHGGAVVLVPIKEKEKRLDVAVCKVVKKLAGRGVFVLLFAVMADMCTFDSGVRRSLLGEKMFCTVNGAHFHHSTVGVGGGGRSVSQEKRVEHYDLP